jgi:hypothetical protein
MLAGMPSSTGDTPASPCDWAAKLIELDGNPLGKPETLRLRVPFILVASQYQHALFGRWPRLSARRLRNDLKEMKLDTHPTLMGLHHFLSGSRGLSVPATLAPQLESLADALDPALANPDAEIQISGQRAITLRDLDTRFSHSVSEGLQFIRKSRCLTQIETDLLVRLAQADDDLSSAGVQRRRPAIAQRTQKLVRDFACRLVRRTLGVRAGLVRDFEILSRFHRVIDGDAESLHDVVRQVESLLNDKDRFVVTLSTTFGESLPPEPRRAVLLTSKQKVRPREPTNYARPAATLRFLTVGTGASTQSIALTYELYRSVHELRNGMLRASLPRTVVALLDTTRARLSGRIVRNEELLDGSEIHIGLRGDVIVRELKKFIVRIEDGR